MSRIQLPKLQIDAPSNIEFDLPDAVLSRYNPSIQAKSDEKKSNTIDIFDEIGASYYSDTGFTSKRMSAALRSIGEQPVVVNINSPGGSYFEGLAIYNMLREHPENVTVRVLGLAASAASVVAMAADDIQIAKSGFLMIHNTFGLVIGGRDDMLAAAEVFDKFDDTAAQLYSRRTGMDAKKIRKMMSDETWMNGDDAVEMGFAHSTLDDDAVDAGDKVEAKQTALRRIDNALAKDGMSRSERRDLIKNLTSKPSAASADIKPSADDKTERLLKELLTSLNAK